MNTSDEDSRKVIDNNQNAIHLRFDITESMSKMGLHEFILDRSIFQFRFNNKNLCILPFSSKIPISKLIKDIRNKLSKNFGHSVNDSQILEDALTDIENQIIEKRDKIFLNTSYQKQNNVNDPDNEYKIEFQREVTNLRNHFREASDPYKEWQLKVLEKYENLEKIFKKYYPEAWIFMEFCLSIKSLLNIMGITLPFMGILVAAPSSLKTMVIQLFRKYPSTFYTDSFTPSSLVSHNASLSEEQLQKIDMLPKMKDKLVLTPELAPLITGKEDELQKVLGIITRVLDGHGLENDTGAHGHRKYGDIMFVWLGAVVEIPPRVWKVLGSLGHKIYFLRPPLAKKTVADLKKIAKRNNFSAINKEIEEALLDYLKTFDAAPDVEGKVRIDEDIVKIRWNEEIEEDQDEAIECIAQLAKLLAPLRGVVYVSPSKSFTRKINNGQGDSSSSNVEQQQKQQIPLQQDGQDYDTDIPTIEDPSRAVVILRNLAIGHAISQGRDSLTLKDVPIVIKVGLSTAQIRRVRILDQLLKSENGVLTTSQLCNQLGISQPAVTKTMREFDALKIGELSAVSNYDNSELQIKLSSEFDWFRTEEFQRLKEGFIPCEDDNKSDKIIGSIEENNESIADNKSIDVNLKSHDNNTDCHMFKKDLPTDTDKKNDVSADDCVGQKRDLIGDSEKFSTIKEDKNEKPNYDTLIESSVSDTQNTNKIVEPLSRSESIEHVTLSHLEGDKEEHQTRYPVSPTITDNDGIKYISLQEILKTIQLSDGSIIAVNYAIESVCKNNKLVREYLGDKLTSRENRNVRDLVSNVIRHPNIKIIKNKPQLLVKWLESNNDSMTNSQKGETV